MRGRRGSTRTGCGSFRFATSRMRCTRSRTCLPRADRAKSASKIQGRNLRGFLRRQRTSRRLPLVSSRGAGPPPPAPPRSDVQTVPDHLRRLLLPPRVALRPARGPAVPNLPARLPGPPQAARAPAARAAAGARARRKRVIDFEAVRLRLRRPDTTELQENWQPRLWAIVIGLVLL